MTDDIRNRRIKYKPGLIPPYYADMPAGLEEIQRSEIKYLDAWDKSHLGTDLRYFFKSIYNIDLSETRGRTKLFLFQLGLHAKGGMGHGAEPFLADELSCLTADAVGLVLYTYQCRLQMLDELQLPLCQPSGLFL